MPRRAPISNSGSDADQKTGNGHKRQIVTEVSLGAAPGKGDQRGCNDETGNKSKTLALGVARASIHESAKDARRPHDTAIHQQVERGCRADNQPARQAGNPVGVHDVLL